MISANLWFSAQRASRVASNAPPASGLAASDPGELVSTASHETEELRAIRRFLQEGQGWMPGAMVSELRLDLADYARAEPDVLVDAEAAVRLFLKMMVVRLSEGNGADPREARRMRAVGRARALQGVPRESLLTAFRQCHRMGLKYLEDWSRHRPVPSATRRLLERVVRPSVDQFFDLLEVEARRGYEAALGPRGLLAVLLSGSESEASMAAVCGESISTDLTAGFL